MGVRPPTPNHTAQHLPQSFCCHAIRTARAHVKCWGLGSVAMAVWTPPSSTPPPGREWTARPKLPKLYCSNYFQQVIALGKYFPDLYDFKSHRGCLIKDASFLFLDILVWPSAWGPGISAFIKHSRELCCPS